MLSIRLQRIGRRNNPSYKVVVVDSRKSASKGNFLELLGTHDTIRKQTALKTDRITYWISQGAQVSDTMHNLLVKNGVIEGVKKNVLPKKMPIKKEAEEQESAPAATAENVATEGEESAPETDSDAPAETTPEEDAAQPDTAPTEEAAPEENTPEEAEKEELKTPSEGG